MTGDKRALLCEGLDGTATGPNLHFEMRINGHSIDPLKSGPELVNNRPSQVELQRLENLRKQYTASANRRFQFASGIR
ncbi:murein DD-endopeptidase MepM/ murein hydrolase activator NlpD [Limibacillus sp. MBR-115]